MPYLAHFGLKEHPFSLTPNTERYFPTAGKTQVLQSLEYGIHRSSGIMKVVGEVGTGKTLLCRMLLRRLASQEGAPEGDLAGVAYLNAPQAEGEALIALVCAEFGLPTGDRAAMLRDLNAYLLARHAAGAETVLVVDEAQALGVAGLETIRLLSNLETERAKLLQIVLFGQTELDALLARPELRQVNQRIAFSFDSEPFSRAEVGAYVKHCLRMSRLEGVAYDVFEPRALEAAAQASHGVPRVINILCDKALLIAYGDGARTVTRAHMRGAIADSASLLPVAPATAGAPLGNGWAWAAGIAGFAAAGGLALWLFGAERLGLADAAPPPVAGLSTQGADAAAGAAPGHAPEAVPDPAAGQPAPPAPPPEHPVAVAAPPAVPPAVVEAPKVPDEVVAAPVPEAAPVAEPAAISEVEVAPVPAAPLPQPRPAVKVAAVSPPLSPPLSKPVPQLIPVPQSKPRPPEPKVAAAKDAPPANPAPPAVQVRSVQVRTVVPVEPGAPVAARRNADGTWEWR